MPETFNRAAMLEQNLQRQIEAIRACDAKITLLVPTTTAMVGVLAAILRAAHLTPLLALYVFISLVPLVAAFALMAAAVIPRFPSRPTASLVFFGNLADRDPAAGRDDLLTVAPEAYLADLAGQCHVTAGIARTKYRLVRRAYVAFFVALPFWTLAIYLLSRPA